MNRKFPFRHVVNDSYGMVIAKRVEKCLMID